MASAEKFENYYKDAANLVDFADMILARESHQASKSGIGPPITVVVSGTPWVGILTSSSRFAEICADEIEALLESDSTMESTRELVRRWADDFKLISEQLSDHVRDHKEDPDRSQVRTRFVHLQNARRAGDSTVYPSIRFKITAIDGWTYGPMPRGD